MTGALVFLIPALSSGFIPGICILIFAISLLTGDTLTLNQTLCLSATGLAVPLAAWLAGYICDEAGLKSVDGQMFSIMALAAGFLLLFEGGVLEQFLELMEFAGSEGAGGWTVLIFISVCSKILLCGGLVAAVLILIQLSIEIPVSWLSKSCRLNIGFSPRALTPFILIAGICLGVNLAVDLFKAELAPVKLISSDKVQ